jgi:hypothetical protein
MEYFLVFLEFFFYPYELPLEVDCYGSTSIYGVATSTTPPYNLTTTNVVTQWALLTKQWDFWKKKSCNATTWAFFAPINTSFSEVSSN